MFLFCILFHLCTLLRFPSTMITMSSSPCSWKTLPQHDAATTMLHLWDGIGQPMRFHPDMTLRMEAKAEATEEKLPSLCHKAQISGVFQWWVSFWKFPYPITGDLQLGQRDHLSYQGSSAPIAQFGQAASSRKSLGCYTFLPFKNNGGHCALGNIQCILIFFCSLAQICASTQSCLWALHAVPLTSWLGFCSDMHCQLWDHI